MTLLFKIGQAILKGIAIVSGILPVVQQELPNAGGTIATISKDLAEIAQLITTVEAAGQAISLLGDQKLKMAAPLVAQIILQSAFMANHKIAQPELFSQGATKIADGMADVLNSLNADGVTVTNKT